MNPEFLEALIYRGNELFEQDADRLLEPIDDTPNADELPRRKNEPMWDERADIDPQVIERVRQHGIDKVLAIYKPISLHGKGAWGIRYFTKAIQSYINYIYRQILVTEPNAKYSDVSGLIFESIRRHEFEHFVQEMAYLAGSIGLSSVEDYSKITADKSLELEAMAAHFEVLDSWSLKGDRRIRNRVLLVIAALDRPMPYRNWDTIDIDSAEMNFELRVSSKSALHQVKKIRGLAKKFAKTKGVPEIHLP